MDNRWTTIISPKKSFFEFGLGEVLKYKDLLFLFVKRDFISIYKQTILGPIWFFIQPILTTIVFTVIFGKVAKLPTDDVPQILFYLSGITCWNYFSECLVKTSNTFIANQNIFGKVYFPRIITPLSIVITSLFKFGIQLGLFLCFYFYYLYTTDLIYPRYDILLLLPLLVVMMGILGLGFGIIISSFTTKYRDLKFLINFGVQLWMYATPVIYPLSMLEGNMKRFALLNPMTSIIETFKYAFLGKGVFSWNYILYTFVFSIVILFFGMLIFNRTQKNFMDTV